MKHHYRQYIRTVYTSVAGQVHLSHICSGKTWWKMPLYQNSI